MKWLTLIFQPFFVTEPGSTPRNLSARPLSASTMVIQWDEPQELSGLVTVSSSTTIYLQCRPSIPFVGNKYLLSFCAIKRYRFPKKDIDFL